jgi:hypothetical protein
MHRIGLTFALLIAATGTAAAQESSAVEGAGYPLGEGTVVHPTVGGELGFTDNVFYADTTEQRDFAGILRLVAEAALASKEITPDEGVPDELLEPGEEAPAEPAPQKIQFRAGGKIYYQEYLSPTYFVRDQRTFGADLKGNVVIAPQGTVAFTADEHFVRDARPVNFESSEHANRIANSLMLDLKYQPGGRMINAGLRWENQIDYFEDGDQRFANRMINTIHARGEWMFFPYSKLFADVSYGFIGSLGSGGMAAPKRSASPIRGGVGIATAITEIFTVKAHLGWGYASYAGGSGYNLPLIGAEIGYRYSPVGRVTVGYEWDQIDSINADFYSDHGLKAGLDQQFGARILAHAAAELHFRTYQGVDPSIGGATSRSDLIFAPSAKVQYIFKDWLAAVVDYRTEVDATSYRSSVDDMDDPSYVRTEITAGVRAAF